MAYTVEITRRAQKEIRKLPAQARDQVLSALDDLEADPRPRGVKKLKGQSETFYRIRVGDYRVIYEINDEVLTILVVRVRHRRDAYK